MSPDRGNDREQAANTGNRDSADTESTGRRVARRTAGAGRFGVPNMAEPLGKQIFGRLKLGQQARFDAIARPVLDARQARVNALLGPNLALERARTRSMMAPLLAAEQARLDAAVRPIQIPQLAAPIFEPLLKSVRTQLSLTPLLDQLMAASALSFEHLRTFPDAPDVDVDVDDLLSSEELQVAVEDFVQSTSVAELLDEVDAGSVTEADAEQARAAAAESFAANPDAWWGLSNAQIVAYLTAVHLLVIATVLSIYDYDVGAVSDVIAWPLAAIAVAELLRRRGN